MITKRMRAWHRWRCMIRRCTDPADISWKHYGGRGITICPEWLASFDAYYAHIGDRPAPGLTVDRINNDGNYEPGNVRWATGKEQIANRRYDPQLLKTHCPQNHPYNEANTYGWSTRHRKCRACNRAAVARYQERKRVLRAATR